MADSPLLPGSHSGPVDPRTGLWKREWYAFLRDLVRTIRESSENTTDLSALLARIEALENAPPPDLGKIFGDMSVSVLGLLGQVVQVRLVNDTVTPGTTYYYGTAADGTKGWHLLGDALLEGTGITLTVDGTTGEITIALADLADAGGGSFLLFTRDAQGRVSGSSAGDASDVPVDDSAWSYLSGATVQAALDAADAEFADAYAAIAAAADTAEWGGITGTLSAQTDLQAALDAKQDEDATLTALAGQNWALNALPIGSGADTVSQVAFAANTFPARGSTGNLVAKTITDGSLGVLAGASGTAGFLRGDGTVSSALTADFTVDSGTLYVDSANNRVGVNTLTPQRPLHAVGPAGPVASFPTVGAAAVGIFENAGNSSLATIFNANASSSFSGFVSGAASATFGWTFNHATMLWSFAIGSTNFLFLNGTTVSGGTDNAINSGSSSIRWASDHVFTQNTYGPLFETNEISPTSLSANTNDYAPTGFSTCRVLKAGATTPINITGLAGGAAGRRITFFNRTGNAITLKHLDAGSAAANRFICPRNVDVVVGTNCGIELWYDAANVWRVIGL